MQCVKSMVVAGCLLVTVSAQAQYGSEYDEYGVPTYQYGQRESPQEYFDNFMGEMREQQRAAERQYYETKPWREYNEQRNACDAIGGNDAARADCFRGLGGW